MANKKKSESAWSSPGEVPLIRLGLLKKDQWSSTVLCTPLPTIPVIVRTGVALMLQPSDSLHRPAKLCPLSVVLAASTIKRCWASSLGAAEASAAK